WTSTKTAPPSTAEQISWPRAVSAHWPRAQSTPSSVFWTVPNRDGAQNASPRAVVLGRACGPADRIAHALAGGEHAHSPRHGREEPNHGAIEPARDEQRRGAEAGGRVAGGPRRGAPARGPLRGGSPRAGG